ncbi:MAG: hypothetical protein NVSMB9_35650 [Isosphaeraceae bacterium]
MTMCGEARGLRGWPRKAARWVVLIVAAFLALAAFLTSRGVFRENARVILFSRTPPANGHLVVEPDAPAS